MLAINRFRRWLAAHYGWLVLAALLLAVAYRMGWRVPGIDRHPSWDEFPHLTNPHLVVEVIPDLAARYGRRYHLPDSAVEAAYPVILSWFDDYYRTNLKNVRTLGFRRTGNTFRWGDWGHFTWTGGNETGRTRERESPHIYPKGYEYLELSLAGMKGSFKEKVYEGGNALSSFYQYNYPAAATDTLFLRYANDDYRVYVR